MKRAPGQIALLVLAFVATGATAARAHGDHEHGNENGAEPWDRPVLVRCVQRDLFALGGALAAAGVVALANCRRSPRAADRPQEPRL